METVYYSGPHLNGIQEGNDGLAGALQRRKINGICDAFGETEHKGRSSEPSVLLRPRWHLLGVFVGHRARRLCCWCSCFIPTSCCFLIYGMRSRDTCAGLDKTRRGGQGRVLVILVCIVWSLEQIHRSFGAKAGQG